MNEQVVSQYRKKPVVIEAVRLRRDNYHDVANWSHARITNSIGDPNDPIRSTVVALEIHTLEGRMIANIGDWVIKGVKGEFYPCRNDIFEATYEPQVYQAEVI